MMQRNHRDRPGVPLTVDERRRFAEIALQLRYELDGLTFPDLAGGHRSRERWHQGHRWHRVPVALAGAARRSGRAAGGLLARRFTPAVLVAVGVAAVLGSSATGDGGLRLGLTATGSFLVAWGLVLAVLAVVRWRQARRAARAGTRSASSSSVKKYGVGP